ncbi:hypothetical protein PGT21_022882 [Puccinia graminis f. sp. tritici]|uniref:SH3 domain-containing protein n=1 Tax=Puccinia graminis f. sp. tritici TaxID=56615 RepID=A0A5B0NCS0_PUCGR|nr:hypothetical protein PGT21_022882 [Puccinia graminis f. sp. tritici]
MTSSIKQQQQQQLKEQQHHRIASEDDEEEEDEDEEDEDLDEEEDDDDDDLYMDQHQQQLNHHNNQQAHNESTQDDEADRASDSSFSDSVSLSSTPSIPCSDDIDFTLVYALHTFLATVDGQASVVKGDRLTLLDDSNSYWWLIRVLKTQAVGYIPAENIETPFERLARLNKHRNVDLSSATPIDVQAGAASSLAQTRFSQRIPSAGDPVRSRSPQDRRKGPGPPPMIGPGYFSPPPVAPAPGTGKGKTVAFTAPTYFENSGNEWSDEEDDESGNEQMIDGDEVADGDWDGEGEFEEGEEGFEDEEEESEEEDDEEEEHLESNNAPQRPERAPVLDLDPALKSNPTTIDSQRQLEEQLAQEHKQQQRQYQLQQQIQHQVASEQSLSRQASAESEEAAKSPSGWTRLRLAARASADSLRGGPGNSNKDDSRSQLGKGLSPVQRAQLDTPITNKESIPEQLAASRNITQAASNAPKNSSNLSIDKIASTSSLQLIPNALTETKKLTLTPDIARDTADYGLDAYQQNPSRGSHPARSRSTSASSSESPFRQSGNKQQARINGEPSSASLEGHSTDSHNGTTEDAKGFKPNSTRKEESDPKKKKTGGLLSGFFGRKKDKKSKNDPTDETRSSSLEHDRNRSSSPLSPSEHSVRSLSSPQLEGSPNGTTPSHRATAENDDLFSTDAALRKQQEEAQEVMHRQYGISREISDPNATHHSQQQKKPSYPPINSNVPSTSLGLHSPFSPGSSTASMGLVYSPAGGRVRPGSLIGSPGIAGMDVPMLNVLRIFAGDNVDCEATFKTVLLSAQTTTQELITQSLQRFHVLVTEEDRSSYYLTIKDVVSGEETVLDDQQTPLKLFELMNESLGQHALYLPSVKRSSVGSISSINSNLSLNPAISRLGMNDFSDDSAVKFHLNRYSHPHHSNGNFAPNGIPSSRKPERSGSLAPIQEDGTISGHPGVSPIAITNTSAGPSSSTQYDPQKPMNTVSNSGSTDSMYSEQLPLSPNASSPPSATTITSSPSLRFAMRVRIHSSDLPEGLVFDPQSNAIIPKTVLIERGQRATPPTNPSASASSTSFREKVIIFPRNIHVSEAIEHTLEAFGIADGVVDGGDDVDDKLSKRRNSSKIRYGLSMKSPDSPTEVPVNLISKVLDAYSVPPIFRPADRTSKEVRRRSQEYHPFVLGTLQDLQPSDPIFSLRRAMIHHPPRRDYPRQSAGQNGLAGAVADELGLLQAKKNSSTGPSRPAPSTESSFKTARESIHSVEEGVVNTPPVASPNPITVRSTQRNSEEGIDINLHNNAMIRSRRDDGPQHQSYRYSYIDPNGEEFDISSLIESELSSEQGGEISKHAHDKHHRKHESQDKTAATRTISPSTEDGYASAPESPLSTVNRLSPSVVRQLQNHETDDDSAIEALRAADLTIDQDLRLASSSSLYGSRDRVSSEDLLAWTVRKQAPSMNQQSDRPSESSQKAKSSPFFAESLDHRIQRLLSKVKPLTNGSSSVGRTMMDPAVDSSVVQVESSPNGPTRSLQKDGPEETLRGSVNSSRSNSTNEDGSISPVTPLTATSPTGESSNYTPISSATRGRGIDSRLSMNREQGQLELRGQPSSLGQGIPPAHRAWLPLLFPSLNSSTASGTEGSENMDSSVASLDVLMNLILLSASSSASSTANTPSSSSSSPSSSSTSTSNPSNPKPTLNRQPFKSSMGSLWNDDPAIAGLFNEHSSSSTASFPLRIDKPLVASSDLLSHPPLLSSADHLPGGLPSNLDPNQHPASHQESSSSSSFNQETSHRDSSHSSSSLIHSNHNNNLLVHSDILNFFKENSNSFQNLEATIDRILFDSLKL